MPQEPRDSTTLVSYPQAELLSHGQCLLWAYCLQNQPWYGRGEKMCSYVTLQLHGEGKAFKGSHCHTQHWKKRKNKEQVWNAVFLVATHQTCVRPWVWLPAVHRKRQEKNLNFPLPFLHSNRKSIPGLLEKYIEEAERRKSPSVHSPPMLAGLASLLHVADQLQISHYASHLIPTMLGGNPCPEHIPRCDPEASGLRHLLEGLAGKQQVTSAVSHLFKRPGSCFLVLDQSNLSNCNVVTLISD